MLLIRTYTYSWLRPLNYSNRKKIREIAKAIKKNQKSIEIKHYVIRFFVIFTIIIILIFF